MNQQKIINRHFDIVIIGAGGAGLSAAISAFDNGCKSIAVICKTNPVASHTVAAKGGINAAFGNIIPDDWRWHAFDTIKASGALADRDVVNYMCREATKVVEELDKFGVDFSRNKDGSIYQRQYGGQKTDFGKGSSAYRACAAKDEIGHSLLRSLYDQCLSRNIKFFNEFFITDFLLSKKQCYGAIAIDNNAGELNIFHAKSTIVASGGYSQIYQNASSANICTGDAGGILLDHGLEMQDMEFVQFHPTGLYEKGLLVTEAARGEGGFLLNGNGERFMKKYDPNSLDLASRDVITRAIFCEIQQGRGCGPKKDHVHLQVLHLDKRIINDQLVGLKQAVLSFSNIDITKDPIPVAPIAHYSMGGIPTDFNCNILYYGQKITGFLAAGEAACNSVHGANRLGCNSLLEIIIFGKQAGIEASKSIHTEAKTPKTLIESSLLKFNEIFRTKQNIDIAQIKKQIQENTENYAGAFRDGVMLEKGLEEIKLLYQKFKTGFVANDFLLWNIDLIDYFETRNLLLQSMVVFASAIYRTESRGAHFRNDFQEKNDQEWLFHSLISFDNKMEIKIRKKEVKI